MNTWANLRILCFFFLVPAYHYLVEHGWNFFTLLNYIYGKWIGAKCAAHKRSQHCEVFYVVLIAILFQINFTLFFRGNCENLSVLSLNR